MNAHPALHRPHLPPTIERSHVTVGPGESWTPARRNGGTLVLIVSGRVDLYDASGATASFGPGSLLPFTAETGLAMQNPTRVPATLTTFTRTTQEH